MKIQNCQDFSDLVDAVLNSGASVTAAAKRAATVKKCSPQRRVGDISEYRHNLLCRPQHEAVIDKIAGI